LAVVYTSLTDLFLNGLRFTWIMSLLADAAVLLRARLAWATAAPPAAGRFDPHPTLLGIGGGGSGTVLVTEKSETAKTLVKSIIHTLLSQHPLIGIADSAID
jgi:hypothetical protein